MHYPHFKIQKTAQYFALSLGCSYENELSFSLYVHLRELQLTI